MTKSNFKSNNNNIMLNDKITIELNETLFKSTSLNNLYNTPDYTKYLQSEQIELTKLNSQSENEPEPEQTTTNMKSVYIKTKQKQEKVMELMKKETQDLNDKLKRQVIS